MGAAPQGDASVLRNLESRSKDLKEKRERDLGKSVTKHISRHQKGEYKRWFDPRPGKGIMLGVWEETRLHLNSPAVSLPHAQGDLAAPQNK